MKGFGLYLIILVCLLAGVSYVVSQTQQTETLSYNQIYNYFMDGDVDQYDVDDTTLTMHLKRKTGRTPTIWVTTEACSITIWARPFSSRCGMAR